MKTIKSVLFLMFIINILIVTAQAQTVIYDNITSSNYKNFVIEDNLNIKNINEYTYDIYLDGQFYGTYHKGDKIFYPDNTNITVYFSPPIKTSVNEIYTSYLKPTAITFLGFMASWGLLILIIIIILWKIYKGLRY